MLERLKRFFPFFSKQERFLVVEMLDKLLRLSSFKVNFEDKKIALIKYVSIPHELTSKTEIFELLAKAIKNFGKLKKYQVMVGLEPGLVTTIHGTAVMLRDNARAQIDEADLNNRIAQGIWKLFDKGRAVAAAKMKVNDLDVLLTDVKVKRIRLDGHRVVSPVGFRAKTVEIQFCHTFSPRFLNDELKKIIPEDNLTLTTESGSAVAEALANIGEPKQFLLMLFMRDKSHLFFSDGGTISFLDSLDWGKINLIESITAAFSVSRPVAEEIIKIYLAAQASPVFIKKIEKLMTDEFVKLNDYLSRPVQKYEPSFIYLLSFLDLPEGFFSANLKNSHKSRVKFLELDRQFAENAGGFKLSGDINCPEGFFSALSPILGLYFSSYDAKMNRIAERHARWLIS